MTVKVVDNLLAEIATHIKDTYNYFCVGSGDTATSGDQVDLEYPIAIFTGDPTNRNKVYESGSVSGNRFTLTFRLASLEPSGQPLTIKELGAFASQTDQDDLGTRFVLPTGQTKDNTSEWVFRVTGEIMESGS